MGKEDQEEEVEILNSIYPEELEICEEDEIALHLKLETEVPRQLCISVKYVDDYPNTAPRFDINVEPCSDEINSTEEKKFTYEYSTSDCKTLVSLADQVSKDNLGMPLVFTVVSAIKERAEEIYEEKIKEIEAERLRQLSLEEEKEQAKFKGTPVTKESFSEWRRRFRAEMGLDKPKERPFGRLTGKELFERGIYEEAEEEDVENAPENE